MLHGDVAKLLGSTENSDMQRMPTTIAKCLRTIDTAIVFTVMLDKYQL